MNKAKSSSFHMQNPNIEHENSSLKMRNLLLEEALQKIHQLNNTPLEMRELVKNTIDLKSTKKHKRYSSVKQRPPLPGEPDLKSFRQEQQQLHHVNTRRNQFYQKQKSHAELVAKLYHSNQRLQSTILQLNEQSENLKEKENEIMKLQQRMKEIQKQDEEFQQEVNQYKKTIKVRIVRNEIIQQNLKQELQDSQNNSYNFRYERQSNDYNRQLQQKLQQTQEYNENLFNDYQKLLRQNQKYQIQIVELQDQINAGKNQFQILKQTENKVQWLEQDLDRLENNSVSDLNKKLKEVKYQQQNQLQMIDCCSEYLNKQFDKAIQGMTRRPAKSVRMLNFQGLNEVAKMSDHKETKQIIQRMNNSQLIQQFIECLFNTFYQMSEDYFVIDLENKIKNIQKKVARILKMCKRNFQNHNSILLKQKRQSKGGIDGSSMINQSTFLPSQGFSLRKPSFFSITDKENNAELINNQNNSPRFDESFENRLIEVLDVSQKKIKESLEYIEQIQCQFTQHCNQREMKNETKRLYDQINQVVQNNELLQLFLKKELTILKQEIVYLIKSQKTAQMPKLL